MRSLLGLLLVVSPLSAQTTSETAAEALRGAKKVVVLGDSITHGGGYVVLFETQLRKQSPKREIEILNLGLPSETVSGLSEVGHAGGKFPRPDLHERLGRVLEKTRPDLILACYGMNDGIYMPLDEGRFQKYKDGLIRLRADAEKAGAKVVHLTPPVFDGLPIKKRLVPAEKVDAGHPFEGYGEVLDRYSDWLLEQRKNGWIVIDLHGPMKQTIEKARETDPTFTMAGDGVHPNAAGQATLGVALCRGFGLDVQEPAKLVATPLYKQIDARSRLLRDAWLSAIGHKRPMAAGPPLDTAKTKAAELTTSINKLLAE